MMLTHICPECKKKHEYPCTPEPDKLCPFCEMAINYNVAEIKVTFSTGNCPMTKEEAMYIENNLREICKKFHIDIENIDWCGID